MTSQERIAYIRKLIAELPPEHTCKDARSLSQIYFDNRQHAARQHAAREIDLSLEENAEDDV